MELISLHSFRPPEGGGPFGALDREWYGTTGITSRQVTTTNGTARHGHSIGALGRRVSLENDSGVVSPRVLVRGR